MEKENKLLKIIVALLSILIVIILVLAAYFILIKDDSGEVNNNQNNSQIGGENDNSQNNSQTGENSTGKIYIVRDGVAKLEKVPDNIVGKYVNNEFDEDYFVLNSDGTAEATWYSGCSSDCGDVKDYFEKNELTFKLTYNDDNSVTLELQPLDKIYEGMFKPYIGKKVNNVYYFEVTVPTPVANPGETKYIKK